VQPRGKLHPSINTTTNLKAYLGHAILSYAKTLRDLKFAQSK